MANTEIYVPDTSVIVEGVVSKMIESKEIKPKTILIHEAVIAELEAQANKNRETGHLGLEEIKKLRELSKKKKFSLEFTGDRPGDFEIRRAKTGEIDSIIRGLALEKKATLITADRVQALVGESKGINIVFYEFPEVKQSALALDSYFDKTTMSVHFKEDCVPKAKKGVPGGWEYVDVTKKSMSGREIQDLAKRITEEVGLRKDGFVEIERKGSTIVQLVNYRIVITRPPFADGYEITAVRPVKRLSLSDYNISDKLMTRLSEQAEGVLISGAPGHGKTTYAQALAEYYSTQNKVVKTVEAPRDLVLPPEVTQYAISHGSSQEIHDILLLSRPDYTIFDEMRNTDDFRLFADMRLSGVGMIGVMHATKPIDAIQRFIGRIELGVIPHIVDTVIFIKNGGVEKVFSLNMEVKVPSGMFEQDLARPVVVVNDFETGKLEFEIYSYGEETVVVPVSGDAAVSPTHSLAATTIQSEIEKYAKRAKVEVVSNNKAVVYVPEKDRSAVIGRQGSTIEKIERTLGISIDVRDLKDAKNNSKDSSRDNSKGKRFGSKSDFDDEGSSEESNLNFAVKIHKSNLTFMLDQEFSDIDVDIFVEGDYVLTAHSSKKAVIKLSKNNKMGKVIQDAVKYKEKVELKVS